MKYPTGLMHELIPWIAAEILGYTYDYTIFSNGSGDTSYDYLLLAFMTFCAGIGMLIWSLLDRNRTSYNQLYYWLLVVVRFYIAFTLINYGMIKVIKMQFPYPSLYRLTQAYGDSSPMGLAWTFLGFSKGYNMFMGIIEVSAVLLLFRRTMIIGAFLSLAACVHVMSMNYFYDVPVKIFSTALVVMSVFILAPYLKTILGFLLTGKSFILQVIARPDYKKKWMFYMAYGLKYLWILVFVATTLASCLNRAKVYGEGAPKPPLYGIYQTEKFVRNNVECLPLITDSLQWRQLTVQREGAARIKMMNDSLKNADFKVDASKKQIEIFYQGSLSKDKLFSYQMIDKDRLLLSGHLNGDSVKITLKKMDLKKFLLINRKFNWVNEYPFNR
ncbi:hypothetical protein [Pedobacter caeni]|nr:hypothetical protein [Pedobacter caeni]